MGAQFCHYYPWRAVHKEGSFTKLERIDVYPSAKELIICLANGENMHTRIPEALIRFCSHLEALSSNISNIMYNRLQLYDC